MSLHLSFFENQHSLNDHQRQLLDLSAEELKQLLIVNEKKRDEFTAYLAGTNNSLQQASHSKRSPQRDLDLTFYQNELKVCTMSLKLINNNIEQLQQQIDKIQAFKTL